MRYLPKLALALLLGASVLVGGCSCEDGEGQAQNVEQVPQAPAGQAADATAPQAPAGPGRAEPAPRQKKQRGTSILNAPTDYLETVVIDSRRHAQETVDLAYVTRDIQAFNALKGRYPESLDELEQWRGEKLPELPGGLEYAYDPSTGKLQAVLAEPAQK